MRYAEHRPAGLVASFVRCIWILEADSVPSAGPAAVERIVPDGCPELVFHFGDPFRRHADEGHPTTQHRTVFVGQLLKWIDVEPTGRTGLLGVRFLPAGAAAVFPERADRLTGRSIPLDGLWGARARAIEDAVYAAGDDASRVAAVVRHLTDAFARVAPRPDVADFAVRRIVETAGRISPSVIARETGSSPRRLEEVFRDRVGIPPKRLCRVVRFQEALRRIARGDRPWAALALDCGFADQSHLVRDFREFAGQPPSRYVEEVHRIGDAFLT